MKKIKKVCKKIFAVLLLASFSIPQIPAAPVKADTADAGTGNTDTISASEETKRDILEKNHLTDTEDSVKGRENGRNPLTGDNEVAVSVNPSPELMIGETDALNASQRTQRVTQTLYDLENSGSFKESGGKVIDQQDEMTNTFSGEVVTAVRTTAFDPLGEGKDAYVAQLLAVHSGYVSGYAGGDGTIIYLRIYDATQKTQIWHTTTVGYLRFDIEEWQADAYMQISAGDYNGDGKDELAVYCPTDATRTSNDMALSSTSSYVALYEVRNWGTKEDPNVDYQEMTMDSTRYYINVTDRNSNHTQKDKDTFKNSVDEICAVDLETIRHPSGTKDSLAIAVCPPRNGTKVTSSMEAETRVDIWLDATKAPSASNLSKHSMRWDLNNYQSNKWKQGKEYDVMYYGGLSAGDMDNDGNDELVVAGYRIRNTADAKKWKLDSRYLFIERLIPYGSGDDYGYKSSGNVPQMINSSDSKDQLIANSGAYGGEDKPTATDKKVLSPLTVECYKGRGRDFADVVFLAGRVYEWKDSNPANYVRKETAQAKSQGGYKILSSSSAKGISGSDSTSEDHRKILAMAILGGHMNFSNAVSGNFDNNPYGIEQLYAVYNYVGAGQAGAAILDIRQKEVGEYDLTNTVNLTLKKTVKAGDCVGISLCAPDVDDDATRVTYASQELYYANPQPVAILQAPPYFSEIAEQDSDYLATGNTSFTTGKGTGVSKTNSFSVTAGIIVGMEQSVSLFGLFKTGLSAMTEVTGGAGYEKQVQTTKTFTTTYNATKEDQVIAVTIPYIRYRYKVLSPSIETMTKAKLKNLSQKITLLKTSAKLNKSEKAKLNQAVVVLKEYYDNQKKLSQKYGYGKTIKDEMVEMTYAQPGTPDMTTLSKDKYNEMVESMGLTDQVITVDVLHNATPGDVASYMWKSSGNDSEYTWSGECTSINGGDAGTSVSQSITEEKTTQKSVTWNAGLHNEATATIGGLTAGLSSTLEYNGAKADITMDSITAQGTVARIPNVDEGKSTGKPDVSGLKDVAVRDKYAFKFRVGTWLTKLGQNDCRVVGYQVEPTVSGLKFPTKPVQNVEVEKVYDTDGNYNGVKVRWYAPENNNPACYSNPTAYKVWMLGSDVTKRAVYASQTTKDEKNKDCYETVYDKNVVPENTAFVAAVRPVELSDDYACCSNPIYIMEQGAQDAIFSGQPKDVTYQAVDANKSGKTQFSGEVKLSGDTLTFDYAREKVRWQFYDPATRTWKEVFELDQDTGAREAAEELKDYGITSVKESLSSCDNIKTSPGTATLDLSYDKIPTGLKFRLAVAYSVVGTSGVFDAASNEVGFTLKTTNTAAANMNVSEDGISVSASTKNDEEGSVIAANLKNLSNNSSSKKILVYPNNLVNMASAAPGVYQLETENTLSSQGAAVSSRVPYYGDRDKLLATLAEKHKTLRSAGNTTVSQADVDEIMYGQELKLTTELYDKNAEDPNQPQTAGDVKYTVMSGVQNEDVTEECMEGNLFRPNSAGEFVVMAAMETGEETLTSSKIIKVTSSGERYEKEVFDKVLNTELPGLQGVVYGTEKSAEALGLPETTQIQTTAGQVYDAKINWNVNNCEYNQASEKEQTFKVKGNVVLPDNVNNDQNASTEVTISVNVNEKAVVVQSPEDNKPPVITLKGSITVGGKVYSDYSDKIVFNTELTGIQKGVITASDEQDEIASISYLKSASALSQDQLDQSTGWIDGKEFTLTEGERCVIYARFVNHSGDVVYVSTQGITVKKVSSSSGVTPSGSAGTNGNTVKKQDPVKAGKTYTVKKIKYKVTANGKKKTVQATGVTDKKMKSLTIPAAVTIQGQKYKVTAIKASAFRNMKKLTKVVIGKNVNKVGGNAFSGCKKLKNIVIQSKAWKKNSLGKKAFYKIAAKPKFKVPAKKLKAYKKYIKKSKVAKKAKITK